MPGSLANLFCGEKRFKNPVPDVLRYSTARVADSHFHALADVPCAHRDRSHAVGLLPNHFTNRVRGIDDQIHHRLIHIAQITMDRRQIRIQFQLHFRHQFPFAAGHGRRAFNSPIEVRRVLFLSIGMGELFHRPHDFADPLHTFQGFRNSRRNLLEQVA